MDSDSVEKPTRIAIRVVMANTNSPDIPKIGHFEGKDICLASFKIVTGIIKLSFATVPVSSKECNIDVRVCASAFYGTSDHCNSVSCHTEKLLSISRL